MRSNNVLVIALIVSVAVNLALVGFVIGRISAAGPAPASMDPFLGSMRVMHALPQQRQEDLRPLLRQHYRGLRPNVREMRRAQRQVNAALAAEPFDPAALESALARFRSVLLRSQEGSHQVLVELAGELTQEERVMLREAMTRSPRGGGERHHGPLRDGLHPPPGR